MRMKPSGSFFANRLENLLANQQRRALVRRSEKVAALRSAAAAVVTTLAVFGLTLPLSAGVFAQPVGKAALPAVTVSAKANRDPVEKSYRKMIRGMDLFEAQRSMSPAGKLRFKLLPRRADTDMARIELEVIGSTEAFSVPVAPDNTFTLARNRLALDENAQVIPNRKAQSMTWRSEIRTPGLPPDTRRLGDLRLECRVGMEAGLVSGSATFVGRMAQALINTPAYCDKREPLYLFFADKPLFAVTLVNGQRTHVLPIDRLFASASDDPALAADLADCDCEVLLDRTYFLPLGDKTWPDDTLVRFDYMEAAP